jgi:2-hydroxycyclohexanecarboxyl-CoA dehydrogenase
MARQPVVLSGALVLVTGAGSGIGEATSLAFARRGATVLCADIDAAAAERTAEACARSGPGGMAGPGQPGQGAQPGRPAGGSGGAYAVDVADQDAVTGMAARVADEHGPLDVLVNNAGVGMSGRFLSMSPQDWDWILGINLMGVVHGCRAFGPAMVEQGHGHVVNLASGLAYTPRATEPGYVTSKAAVLALSRCLRADWGPNGVGVSAICPGVIATPIIERTRFKGDRAGADTVGKVKQAFAKGHPPALVADAIVGAVERNRAVVAVGIEARIGWALNGLLPSRVVDAMARATPRGI